MRRMAAILALWLAACGRGPRGYPVPYQREVLTDPSPVGEFVEMRADAAPAYIVADVAGKPEGLGWRWTYREPRLRFLAPPSPGWKFAMDFSIPPPVFQATGPVTLSVLIDGRPLGRTECPAPGNRRFERPVPPGWIAPGDVVTVTARLDKQYAAPDGVRLGYVLWRAGFIP